MAEHGTSLRVALADAVRKRSYDFKVAYRYSPDEHAEMVRVYEREHSLKRTAALLGCSRATVRRALKAAGVQTRRPNKLERRGVPYTASARAEMVKVYSREQSLMRAGEILGCSHNTVRAALREAGIPVKRSGGRVNAPGTPPRWNRRIASNGYAVWSGWISVREAVTGHRHVEILEHRLELERFLGRALERHEEVHHRNGLRSDNGLRNLELRVGRHGAGATHCPHCGQQITPAFELTT
jgi:transposase-like protein